MKLSIKTLKKLFLCCFSGISFAGYTQVSDSSLYTPIFASPVVLSERIFGSWEMPAFNPIYHSKREEDDSIYQADGYLVDEMPDSSNYETYYQLACVLWNLEKVIKAEKMFLVIIKSKEKHYSTTWYHSSDIPGDTTTNTYGYGSFTSSYKNSAAIFLTKIYIEQRKFSEAFKYVQQAINKYPVKYSCGTGYLSQKRVYDFLYAACYTGLKQFDKVLHLLLPTAFDECPDPLLESIKKKYSPAIVKAHLLSAEKNMRFTFDKEPILGYTEHTEGDSVRVDSLKYYSGSAEFVLFDRKIKIRPVHLDNGDRVDRAYLVNFFRKNFFYKELARYAGISDAETSRL